LPALALAGGLVSIPVSVLSSRLSRAVERRADDFALRQPGAPGAFVSFERAIALQNVADVTPARIMRLLASHPSTAERIGAALAHERAAAQRLTASAG
jgi:STE24 endopeptidase